MSDHKTIAEKNDISAAIWSALKSSVFPGARDESIAMACLYCRSRKLDVLKKPVHIVPMNIKNAVTGKYAWQDIIMPGIAEHRITASRTQVYAGQDEPEFGPVHDFQGIKAPEWAKVTVYRLVDGVRCAFSHVERFGECVGRKKDGSINYMWSVRPYGQNAKCAEAGALRKAFPEELGGEITADEIEGQEIFLGSVPRETVESAPDEITMPKAKKNESIKTEPEPEQQQEKTFAKDPPKTITPQQVKMLKIKIDGSGMGVDVFCNQYNIKSVSCLPTAEINNAFKWLFDNETADYVF